MSVRFNIKAVDPVSVARLERELDIPHFIAATLVARGIDEPGVARRFLEPSLERDWIDPYAIPGLSDVADALEAAIKRGDHILVFGDFDLDGISATTVLTRGLRALGAQATPFIPLRFEEGYALSKPAFVRACSLGPDFIVTVDCGIACKYEAAAIVDAGVGLAVTDHHEPTDLVPEGIPVADPKCDPTCESVILAGVGVALKLVQVLGGRFGQPHLWREYTDFATLGTVADLMPMRGENRALVADGLERINKVSRPCIAALLATSGVAGKSISATNLSFSLVPRLNAAGRMGNAQLALDLLMTDDFDEAVCLADQLELLNDQRRAIEAQLSEIAKIQAAEIYHGQRALVVAGAGWHEGVKGIVASRLANAYGVPTLLFTIDGDEARGSGRSVGQVNLFKAIESVSDLLTCFGGHEAAVGVTLPTAQLGEFECRLCAYMDTLPESAFHPLVQVDACVSLDELTLDNVAQLDRLAPFGQEYSVPVYFARDVMLANARAVGSEKNHFSCLLTDGRSSISGIMFHCPNVETLMHTESVVSVAFEIQIDEWRGRKSVKALLRSIVPARTCAGFEACLDPDDVCFVTGLYDEFAAPPCADIAHCCENTSLGEDSLQERKTFWERKATQDPKDIEQRIIHTLIGARSLHRAQRDTLDYLYANRSTLAVMATGRGKSLIFQIYAIMRALRYHEASLLIYPLRALVADQAFHLEEVLGEFGIRSVVLTGESTPEERKQAFSGLAQATYDIALTTPEFFVCHIQTFSEIKRIRFAVIDEAHHLDTVRMGQRAAYAALGTALAKFDNLLILALTATAGDDTLAAIKQNIPVDACVFDNTDRPNLHVDDQRNLRSRDDYLSTLVAAGEKTVVYVNSREQSVALARTLRKRLPHIASLIGFYNAGLSRSERTRIEQLFRIGALHVLVATSAFGEGVDIPDIRHIVLYHLPFNEIEFNQMSGRAGRDGYDAVVHLLFGRADCALNERILYDMTPDHDHLAQIYRKLRSIQRAHDGEFFVMGDVELAQAASTGMFSISPASAACGIAVFRELGLIETREVFDANGVIRSVRVNNTHAKVELTDSVRYREGLGEREIFYLFRDWAMKSTCTELHKRLSCPILPREAVCGKEGGDGKEYS